MIKRCSSWILFPFISLWSSCASKIFSNFKEKWEDWFWDFISGVLERHINKEQIATLVVKCHGPEVNAVGVDLLCGQLQVCNPLLSSLQKAPGRHYVPLSIILTKPSKEAPRTLNIFYLKFLNWTLTRMTSEFLTGSTLLFTGDFEKVLCTFNVSTLWWVIRRLYGRLGFWPHLCIHAEKCPSTICTVVCLSQPSA